MRRVFVVMPMLAMVACYAPVARTGAPCDEQNPCPSKQECIGGVCGGTIDQETDVDAPVGGDPDAPDGAPAPVDSSTDASVLVDGDNDGLVDAADNCPAIANANQFNEDGDKFGDVCDPCPPFANDSPSDPDGDKVADACDPRPNQAGDSITVFEGFHQGVPSGWTVIGNTMQMGDDIVMVGSANNHNTLSPPNTAPANGVLTIRAAVLTVHGDADASLSTAMPYDPNNDSGVMCDLYAPTAGSNTGKDISIWDSIQGVDIAAQGFVWQNNTTYTTQYRRTGNSYTCSTTATGITSPTVSGNTSSQPSTRRTAAYTYAITARVSWYLLVTSP